MFDWLIGNFIEYGNIIEGFFWVAIGVCFTVALRWPKQRGIKLVTAITFLMFGCSDFVEYQTGAWWRPWWLMLWKGACVCIMAAQLIVYVRGKRSASDTTTGRDA